MIWDISKSRGGLWLAVNEPCRLTVQADTYAELMETIDETEAAIYADLARDPNVSTSDGC